ncbi:hypothetical protein CORC01_06378 [Colletotrichum orchidophilum]|uniref:Uncharacterized protein n=1 Tax=Colletotrichum orchidophilum TaxID=1209926 RepID=A0A1G4BAQ9_9PEZI|nr:uncharacterized protein CORC01_06378 [Colletotrichum orchidophilum]OHE98382.1 hypothetical protein CORC01_06378 [Colletotrichum orchidophilum]
MSTYTVKVDIDEKWVKKFNKDSTKLCFSHGMLTRTQEVTQNVFLKWTDVYSIAAGTQEFSAGTEVTAITDNKKIEFKQRVELGPEFLLGPPLPDAALKDGQFAFKNKVEASAYLYKKISKDGVDVVAPFYVSMNGPNPPGSSILTPKPITRLYFANKVETGSMIDDFQSETIDVDLTGKVHASVKYDVKGDWSLVA